MESGPREDSRVPGTRKHVVLIVDDDHATRAAVQELLVDAGYEVLEAGNGEEAIAMLAARPAPAAILVDLFMPTMNGWDFVERLRRQPDLAAIPLVLVTATGPHWGYPVPPEQVVRKPFRSEQLLAVLDRVLTPAS